MKMVGFNYKDTPSKITFSSGRKKYVGCMDLYTFLLSTLYIII